MSKKTPLTSRPLSTRQEKISPESENNSIYILSNTRQLLYYRAGEGWQPQLSRATAFPHRDTLEFRKPPHSTWVRMAPGAKVGELAEHKSLDFGAPSPRATLSALSTLSTTNLNPKKQEPKK